MTVSGTITVHGKAPILNHSSSRSSNTLLLRKLILFLYPFDDENDIILLRKLEFNHIEHHQHTIRTSEKLSHTCALFSLVHNIIKQHCTRVNSHVNRLVQGAAYELYKEVALCAFWHRTSEMFFPAPMMTSHAKNPERSKHKSYLRIIRVAFR